MHHFRILHFIYDFSNSQSISSEFQITISQTQLGEKHKTEPIDFYHANCDDTKQNWSMNWCGKPKIENWLDWIWWSHSPCARLRIKQGGEGSDEERECLGKSFVRISENEVDLDMPGSRLEIRPVINAMRSISRDFIFFLLACLSVSISLCLSSANRYWFNLSNEIKSMSFILVQRSNK